MRFTGNTFYRIIGLLLPVVVSNTVLFASESDSIKSLSIREVTVTEKQRTAEVRSSAPLQILTAKQIGKLNVLQVSDAVKYFSGVTVKDYGGIGGLKTVSVRSLGAGHTAVSYDGVSLTDCQTGQIDIGRFSLDNVDMLSLSNGQSDNIFQSARLFASAAVLNIRTITPQFEENKTVNGKISFKGGSFGMVNPSAWLQYKISRKISAAVSAEWLSADGKYPYKLHYGAAGDSVSNEKRKNSDVENFRLEGALYATLSPKESAYLKVYYYQSERGLPGGTIFYNEKAFTSQRMWDHTFFAQGHYEKDFSQFLSFQSSVKLNQGYLHYLDTAYLNSIGRQESVFRQNEYYGSLSLLYKAFEKLSFSLSADGFVNTLDARYESEQATNEFPQPVRYNFLSVAAAKYVSEHLLGTASILSTVVKETVEKGDAAVNRDRLSPYLSFTYKPFASTDLRFRAFYKNIFRLPTFNDLYYSRVGNTNLKPENTDQFNLGVTYSLSAGQWLPLLNVTVDAYRNNVQDKIVAMPTKNLFVWSMVNLGKVEITGLDVTAESSLKITRKLGLALGGTCTYLRALDVTDPAGSSYRHQIPYTPRISGSGKLAVETPWVDVAYSMLWSGHRYAGYQNYAVNRLAGYSDHSISVSKEFIISNKVLNVSIEALNIMNENYAIVKSFPMPGRSFRVTVSYRF